VARRTPQVATVVVNGSPAVCCAVPSAYNTVPTPSPIPQRTAAVQTTVAPPLAPVNPHATFIESVQTTQEKDTRAIQEMVEHRQANLALIRTMQAADANTVAAFEKLVLQMKEDSPKVAPIRTMPTASDLPVDPGTPTVVAPPAVPTIPVIPVPTVVVPVPTVIPAPPAGTSAKEIQALMEELDRLARKVKELNSQTQALPDK
jgi:hypothetical protein